MTFQIGSIFFPFFTKHLIEIYISCKKLSIFQKCHQLRLHYWTGVVRQDLLQKYHLLLDTINGNRTTYVYLRIIKIKSLLIKYLRCKVNSNSYTYVMQQDYVMRIIYVYMNLQNMHQYLSHLHKISISSFT